MKAVNRAIAVSCALFSFMTAGLSQDIEHKWAVEVHAGGMLPSRPSSGNGVVFPRGEDFTAMNGQPSRRITSWYFGDGSVLLNQVLTAMGRAPEVQITPLDTLLTRSSIQNESSPVFGLRISRTLSRRFEVDVTADYKRKGMAISSEGLAAIEASRSTFITAWNASGLPNLSVSSTSTIRITSPGMRAP